MPTVTFTVRYAPAIREGANITAAAVQTVFARGGLYRRIPGPLTQDIRIRLSPTGAVVGAPIIFIREDIEPYTVTIEDWGGTVLTVMGSSQSWTTHVERGATAWKKISDTHNA